MATFTCPIDHEEFEAKWSFGDRVTCPKCKSKFETDYETNYDDDIQGPWIIGGPIESRK